MSTPDREEVEDAMHGIHEYKFVICAAQRDVLRANARDVARQLRERAKFYDYPCHAPIAVDLERLADQLDPKPQPVSKSQ